MHAMTKQSRSQTGLAVYGTLLDESAYWRVRPPAQGNRGDCEPVGQGVSELRMFFGPGYRVYFGEQASDLVVLLCGGDKGTQQQDIKTAIMYWKEYLSDEETQDVR